MITEDYVSYEVAKLLKEKGFNEKCISCYNNEKQLLTIYHDTLGEIEPEDWNNISKTKCGKIGLATWYGNISAPTHQMAMKWLREVHNIFININVGFYGENMKRLWDNQVYRIQNKIEDLGQSDSCNTFLSYEEAVEAALEYLLENLI